MLSLRLQSYEKLPYRTNSIDVFSKNLTPTRQSACPPVTLSPCYLYLIRVFPMLPSTRRNGTLRSFR